MASRRRASWASDARRGAPAALTWARTRASEMVCGLLLSLALLAVITDGGDTRLLLKMSGGESAAAVEAGAGPFAPGDAFSQKLPPRRGGRGRHARGARGA